MPAIVIGHIKVRDPAKWERYRAGVPATLAPWGGQLLVRGRRLEVLSGTHDYTDSVVLSFPDPASAAGWHASPAYQALLPLRAEAADVLLVSYETTA